jgi:2-haloacid dehalogenase
MLDFSRFEFLTFDCYGTLINWEAGILAALQPLLRAHRVSLPDQALLELYAELESTAEEGPYLPYREVLATVVRGVGQRLGFTPTVAEAQSLAASVPQWPPFPDSVAALAQLRTRFGLAVISNVDDDLFAASARLLGNPFTHAITAQQAGSYKPSHNNFQLAFKRLGVSKEKILHVAESRHHDITPARALGLTSVWVNRRAGKDGSGATRSSQAQPDLEVRDLRSLATLALP